MKMPQITQTPRCSISFIQENQEKILLKKKNKNKNQRAPVRSSIQKYLTRSLNDPSFPSYSFLVYNKTD